MKGGVKNSRNNLEIKKKNHVKINTADTILKKNKLGRIILSNFRLTINLQWSRQHGAGGIIAIEINGTE